MRIMIAMHSIMDLGGIINYTEQMIGGFKDLGHEVDFFSFSWTDSRVVSNTAEAPEVGPSGIPFSQSTGWKFKAANKIHYKGFPFIVGYRNFLKSKKYDIIIWTTPVPSSGKKNAGNSDWLDLYEVPAGTKQMAIIHDGNSARLYPHMMRIQDHLDAVACVHPCALNSSGFLDVPRAMVVNPQHNPVREFNSWESKKPGFVNMQTFKAWKHVHELITSIAYMPRKREGELREVAGRGIEYQYMTSRDKCKEAYFHEFSDQWFSGERIWETAIANGMTHHDYWTTPQVDEVLQQARVLVDPSWSLRYSADGGHFNRVAVDAMIRGAVPVARAAGMGNDFFRAGENYIEIPPQASPQEYADIVLEAGNMPFSEARKFHEANRELLPTFDRKVVAQRMIDLAFGNIETLGKDRPAPTQAADRIMFEKFGSL